MRDCWPRVPPPAGDISVTPAGDQLAMLRDPWGFAIQLAKRNQPMI